MKPSTRASSHGNGYNIIDGLKRVSFGGSSIFRPPPPGRVDRFDDGFIREAALQTAERRVVHVFQLACQAGIDRAIRLWNLQSVSVFAGRQCYSEGWKDTPSLPSK